MTNVSFLAMKGECWSMRLNSDQGFTKKIPFPNIRELFGDSKRGTYFSLFAEAGFSLYADQESSEVMGISRIAVLDF